ncbi:hypothetical protein JCM11641_003924 [Rhodosporidiobolus odoratus]
MASNEAAISRELQLETPAPSNEPVEPTVEADHSTAAQAGEQPQLDSQPATDQGNAGQASEEEEELEVLAKPTSASDTVEAITSTSTSFSSPSASILPTQLPPSVPPSPPANLSSTPLTPAPPPNLAKPPLLRPHPPKKGILRPPSSSHAGPSSTRFSFRRDVLQSLTAGAPAGAVAGGVQEAVGSAASVAGGFFGSAFKRLSAAAAGAGAGAGSEAGIRAAAVNGSLPAAGSSIDSLAPVLPSSSSSLSPSPSSFSDLPARNPSPNPTTPSSLPSSAAPTTTTPAKRPPLPPPLPISDLKRVRFRTGPTFSITYRINRGQLEAIAPLEEGATREEAERVFRATRRGVEVGGEKEKALGKGKGRRTEKGKGQLWTGGELGRIYEECCRVREEQGVEKIRRAFRDNPTTPPKTLDLSQSPLSLGAVEALADLMSLDWGCKKLVLDNCTLDDESIKPLLHALLVSAGVPTLSLAGNRRIKQKGWRLLAVFVRKASFLRYLDLSETSLDRRSAEMLVQALNPPPAPCPAPAPVPPPPPPEAEDVQANGRNGNGDEETQGNKKKKKKVAGPWDEEEDSEDETESSTSAEAEGDKAEEPPIVSDQLMEEAPALPPPEPLFDTAPLLKDDEAVEGALNYGAVSSLRLENCGLRGGVLEALAQGVRTSQLKHISLRRNRINAQGAVHLALMIRDYPLFSNSSSTTTAVSDSLPSHSTVSSPSLWGFTNGGSSTPSSASYEQPPSSFPFDPHSANSVTARQRPLPPPPPASGGREAEEERQDGPAAAEREAWRLSEAKVRLKKQVEEFPRVGALLTLDVKGNDIRNGVSYIAQVLKRNRTLKVLNLSENKVEWQGLVAIAEALKYNTSLETLDLSFNPCCGPTLDGILALRSAMMVSSLKRLFLNHASLTSESAIALAEFLPESRLLHLDLTDNDIDISGVLALSVSLKMNHTLRCLDVQIPFDDPDFSRMSQDILETCVRNTELAQAEAEGRASDAAAAAGGGGAAKRVVIAQPIRKSALASNLEAQRQAEQQRRQRREEEQQQQVDIFAAAAGTRDVVVELLGVDQQAAAKGILVAPSEVVRDALVQLQLAEAQLAEAFNGTRQGGQRDRAEILLTELASLLDLAKTLYDKPPPPAPVSPRPATTDALQIPPPLPVEQQPSSPTFSLTSSESASEEEDDAAPTAALPTSPPKPSTLPLDLDIPSSTAALAPPESSSSSSSPTTLRSPVETEARAMVAEESVVFRKSLAMGVDDVPSDSESEDAAKEHLGDKEVSGEELKREILEAPEVEESVTSAGGANRRRGSRGSFSAEQAERPSKEGLGGDEGGKEEEAEVEEVAE